MRMLCLILFAALCSGCSVTLNATGRWDDGNAELVALQGRMAQVDSVVKQMSTELQSTPGDINAVDAVLSKYGIRRGTSAINEQK